MLSLSSGVTLSLPQPVFCLLFIMLSVVTSQLALTAFHKYAVKYKLPFHNEVAGLVFGGISLVYSLLLAFVIVAVWDDYTDLQKNIETEADELNAVVAHTEDLPDSIKANVRQSVYNYCNEVVNNEWEMNSKNKSVQRPNAIRSLRLQLLSANIENKKQEKVLAAINNKLEDLDNLRRERLSHSHSQIPQMVWFSLITGSTMMVLFFFFLNVPSLQLKRIFLGFLVSCMAMCMFLVYSLDHPFNNTSGVSVQSLQDLQTELKGLNYK